jgi:DNA repair protein RadA/Sms
VEEVESASLINPKAQSAFSALQEPEVRSISEIEVEPEERFQTNLEEFDRVLGGGVVAGSVILVGGEPGIGKSTLLLQASQALSQGQEKVLYVSGEESIRQTRLRADRLGTHAKNLYLLSETNLELIMAMAQKIKPKVIILDSIQVIYSSELNSSPGSVSQVRECAARLVSLAKTSGVSLFLVGHVTKEGAIAGPRVLEHLVDCVLYFEGESQNLFRILRAVKNRFGSTNEIGVFQMTGQGLTGLANPSELFLAERAKETTGSVIVACLEGTRTLLVEIQALTSQTNFGIPRRSTSGIDYNRLCLLVAVLEKRVKLSLYNQDIFVNVVGGIKVQEPAVDLGICLAIASSLKNIPTRPKDIFLGEVGLGGEVRAISQAALRLNEAEKLGFSRCFISRNNLKDLKVLKTKIETIAVEQVQEAIELALKP